MAAAIDHALRQEILSPKRADPGAVLDLVETEIAWMLFCQLDRDETADGGTHFADQLLMFRDYRSKPMRFYRNAQLRE